jgi:hypothetical protein
VLVALLPVLGTLGWWIIEEFKKYNEAYQAQAEVGALRQEKNDLQRQKDSLNIEVDTLLQLKKHYADETQRLQRDTATKQYVLNTTYLRGVFEMGEALYALDLIKGMRRPDDNALQQLQSDAKQLLAQSGRTFDDVLNLYDLSMKLIDITRGIISEFDNTLKLVPASDWTRALRWNQPGGSVLRGRKILVLWEGGKASRFYDVDKGRYLT